MIEVALHGADAYKMVKAEKGKDEKPLKLQKPPSTNDVEDKQE